MSMIGKTLLVGSLLAVIAGSGLVAFVHHTYEGPDGVQSKQFDLVAPDLYRMGYSMKLIPKVMELHVSTFLVKSGKDYILIDAGWPGKNFTDLLIPALKDATKGGTLRFILMTHGHVDHIGNLMEVAEAFPDAQVAMHILEAPYLAGGVSYGTIPADNMAYSILRKVLPEFVKIHLPVHRILYLSGEEGDVSEVKGATGQPPKWAPPKGLLQYVRVPGHAPGQMAFIHKPSGSLLMADAIANQCGGLVQKQPPKLVLVPPGSSYNLTQGAQDIIKLSGLDFTTAFPSHDHGTGVPKAAVMEFAQSLQSAA